MTPSELIVALSASGAVATAIGAIWSRLQQRQIAERQRQITERFSLAIDRLGSDKADVRLDATYVLESIARNSPTDRATIDEILTAFVRLYSPWPPRLPGQYIAGAPLEQLPELEVRAPDVQAALTVIGRNEPSPTGQARRLDLHSVDLRKADLSGAYVQHANLAGAQLEGANLADAQLQDSILAGAQLQDANLVGAQLQRANLASAQLQRANLRYAQLHDVDLERAQLQDANLAGAQLQNAFLAGAQLAKANLADAQLQGASADMRTVWPEEFDWRSAGAMMQSNTVDG
jgi:uncharacterized protein YjbI with pentapeptide repeats